MRYHGSGCVKPLGMAVGNHWDRSGGFGFVAGRGCCCAMPFDYHRRSSAMRVLRKLDIQSAQLMVLGGNKEDLLTFLLQTLSPIV